MKILHVIRSLDPRSGGPIDVVRNFVRGQVHAGYRVSLLATTAQATEPWEPAQQHRQRMLADADFNGVDLRIEGAFGRRPPWSTYSFSPAARKWLRRRMSNPDTAPDVVHIHGVFSHVTSCAAALARRRSIPYLIEPFGCLAPTCVQMKSPRLKKLFTRFYLRKDLRRAACVHLASQYEAEQILRWIPDGHLQVIPHGVDIPEFDTAEASRHLLTRFPQLSGKRVLLFMGRVHAVKRPELIVDAMARLKSEYPNLALFVVGSDEGHLKVVRASARRHGLEDAIVEGGFLQGKLKQGAFAIAELFVQPSIHENFGVAVAEAMAHGVPVLVTPGVATHLYVDQSGAGITVKGTAEAIAEGMRKMLVADRKDMSSRGRRFVEQHLSWPNIIRQIDELYQNAVTHRRVCSD